MATTTTLRGGIEKINGLINDLKAFEGILKGSVINSLANDIGAIVLDNTEPFVPEDTGALVQSGKYAVENTSGGVRVRISYGGDTPVTGKNSPAGVVVYAVDVHENVEANFNREKKPFAQAKFLEAGISISEQDIKELLIDRVREELNI